MTRERWMLGAVALVVFLLVAVGTVLIAKGDSNTTVAVSATTTSSTTTTSEPSSTTSTSSTPSVTIGIICATPEEAVQSLIDAWIAGDQAGAARCALPAAVTSIFQTSGAGAVYTFQGCIGDETTEPIAKQCGYTYEGGAIVLEVAGSAAAGWQVQSHMNVAG